MFLQYRRCSSSTLVCCSGVKQEINQHRTPLLTFLSLNQNTNTEKLNLHVTWHRTAITYSSRYTFGQKCSSVVKTLEKPCGELHGEHNNEIHAWLFPSALHQSEVRFLDYLIGEVSTYPRWSSSGVSGSRSRAVDTSGRNECPSTSGHLSSWMRWLDHETM